MTNYLSQRDAMSRFRRLINNNTTNQPHYYVTLPNGNRVDITTKEGANGLLEQADDFNYFSEAVTKLSDWENNGKMKFQAKHKLLQVFTFLPKNADPELFSQKVPQAEIQCWLDYVIDRIKQLTTNKSWIHAGDVTEAWLLLDTCQILFLRPIPVTLAFKSDFFQALSTFIKARKGYNGRAMPSSRLCELIVRLVVGAVAALVYKGNCAPGNFLKKLEATGMLEEYLRCATSPYPSQVGTGTLNHEVCRMLSFLQHWAPYLFERFQRGEPCGDTLQAILDGRDGNESGLSLPLEEGLQAVASAMAKAAISPECCKVVDNCTNCGKLSREYCHRCKYVYYCSKACQNAHWMDHKSVCKPVAKIDFKYHEAIGFTLETTLEEHRHYIDRKLMEACHTLGAKKMDLILELDFSYNLGVVPAMENPPILRIVQLNDYQHAKELSPWVSIFKERDPKMYDNLVEKLSKSASLMGLSEPCCRVVYRNPGGDVSTIALTMAKEHVPALAG